jgi:hypothetical protein
MAANNCLSQIKDYAKSVGEKFDERKLEEYANRFEQLSRNKPHMTRAQVFEAISNIIEQDAVRMAEKVKAAKLQNLKTVAEAVALVRDNRFGGDAVDNIEALLTGKSDRVVKGGNNGILANTKGLAGKWLNQLMFAVEEHKPLLERGALDREILHALNGADTVGGAPISPAAKKVADAYNKIMASVFDQKKSVNPFLERIEDYFVKQTHAREKVSKVKFDEWETDVRSYFGKKSFADLSDAEISTKLAGIYEAIVNDEYSSSYTKKPGDKMYAMTRERKLIPNDAESFYQYQKKYGDGNVFETMQKTIRQSARDVAVIQRLGSDPMTNFELIKRTAMRGADEKTLAKLADREPRIKAQIENALGFSSEPARNLVGKVTQAVLTWEGLSKLSGVYLSLIDDVQRAVGVIEATTGENPVKNIAEMTRLYMNSFFSEAHAKEAAKYIDVYMDALHGGVASELGGIENAPGVAGRISKTMNKLTLMTQHSRAAVTATAISLAKVVADKVHLEFDALPESMKLHMFERYGLNKEDWAVIRKGVEDSKFGKLVTAEGIEALPDSAFSDPKDRARIANTWSAMMNDIADIGSSTAGAHEFAFMNRGKTINDPIGALLRFFWLFKSSSLKNYNTTKRLYFSGQDPMKGNWSGVAKLVGAGLVTYTMKRWAQDAISGKTPSDPSSAEFVAPALASALAAGPAADMFMHVFQQDYNQFGFKGQLAKAIVGPVGDDALDYADMLVMLGNAPKSNSKVKADDIAGKLGRLAVNSPLGAPLKLPYTKSIADYYIINEIRQLGNSRYFKHLREQMKGTAGPLTEEGLWGKQEYFMLDPRHK